MSWSAWFCCSHSTPIQPFAVDAEMASSGALGAQAMKVAVHIPPSLQLAAAVVDQIAGSSPTFVGASPSGASLPGLWTDRDIAIARSGAPCAPGILTASPSTFITAVERPVQGAGASALFAPSRPNTLRARLSSALVLEPPVPQVQPEMRRAEGVSVMSPKAQKRSIVVPNLFTAIPGNGSKHVEADVSLKSTHSAAIDVPSFALPPFVPQVPEPEEVKPLPDNVLEHIAEYAYGDATKDNIWLELTQHVVKSEPIKKLAEKAAQFLPRIREVGHVNFQLTRTQLGFIATHFTALETLHLKVKNLTNADLQPLGQAQNLKALCLERCARLTPAALEPLAGCQKLQRIILGDAPLFFGVSNARYQLSQSAEQIMGALMCKVSTLFSIVCDGIRYSNVMMLETCTDSILETCTGSILQETYEVHMRLTDANGITRCDVDDKGRLVHCKK